MGGWVSWVWVGWVWVGDWVVCVGLGWVGLCGWTRDVPQLVWVRMQVVTPCDPLTGPYIIAKRRVEVAATRAVQTPAESLSVG